MRVTEGQRIQLDNTRYLLSVRPASYNRLGLIITRLDAGEASDSIGEYAIVLRAGI